MLKISDILKKTRQPAREASGTPLHPPPVAASLADVPSPLSDQPQEQPHPAPAEEPAAGVQPQDQDRASAAQFYAESVAAIRPLLTPYASEVHLQKARAFIAVVIRQLQAGNEQLLEFFFQEYPVDTDYLAFHAVNVCILAVAMGKELNYDAGKLAKLGLAALLHDIGLATVLDHISRPQPLTEQELAEMRRHPVVGKDLAAKVADDLEFEVFDVIQQEHERVDGSGYPQGLEGNEISEFAKLVAVADVYEALTHGRPHRPQYAGREAVRLMLEKKRTFSLAYLKVLINIVGVFPLGTRVELNTRETGVVVHQTRNRPLRPTILITHNAQKQKLAVPKRVELPKNFSLYIRETYPHAR